MRNRIVPQYATVGLFAALLAGSAACSRQEPGPTTAAPASSSKALASTGEIMRTMTIPFSEVVFKAASEAPANDAAWSTVREHAVALAEAGNLLLVGSRRKEGNWATLAEAQVDAAVEAATAASEKSADKLGTASDRLYGTCEDCHKVYLK